MFFLVLDMMFSRKIEEVKPLTRDGKKKIILLLREAF